MKTPHTTKSQTYEAPYVPEYRWIHPGLATSDGRIYFETIHGNLVLPKKNT